MVDIQNNSDMKPKTTIIQFNRSFYLDTDRKQGEAFVYFRYRKAIPGTNRKLDKVVNTQVIVDVDYWYSHYEADMKASTKPEQALFISNQLKRVSNTFEEIVNKHGFDKSLIDAAISDCVEHRSFQTMEAERERIRKELAEAEKQAKKLQEEKADVLLFMQNFLDGIRSGEIKNGAETYNKNTCKVWSNFLGILKRFYETNPFTWTDINKSLTDRFVCFMEDEGYMVKSINKYLICFRAMVGYAYEQGMHENTLALKSFSKKKVQESDKAKEIYLTESELQALYEMKLDGLKEKIRDVFLVGCYTCQRFSDYSRLERENFTTTAKGTRIVRIVQEKTGNSVVIPILNDNLLRIAERYDYEIPHVNDVVLNRYIKQILKELSETVPTLARLERTVLTMKERAKEERGEVSFMRDAKGHVVKPRYDLVSSHTARRSGITNLYLTGLFDSFQMMSVSGHKDEKTFNEYIKLSSDEIADAIAKKIEERNKNKSSNEGLF